MAQKPANTVPPASMEDVTVDAPPSHVPAVITSSAMALGAVEGDVSANDLRLPRLQIAYGVGRLAESFNPGDLVLGEDNLLVKKGEPLDVIILNARQYWKQYLSQAEFQAKMTPAVYLTEEEVLANGGTTAWQNNVGPTFNRALHMKLLIKQPKDIVCGLFGVELGEEGVTYAPAVWDVDKSAYRRIAPIVLSAAQFSLRAKGLLYGIFQITTRSEKINDNITIVPGIKLTGYNSDAVVNAIKAIFAPRAKADEPAPF